MTVTWTTFNSTKTSTVWYGKTSLNMSSTGTSSLFIDGGNEKRHMYIHRVTLSGLEPDSKYGKN